MKNQNSNSVIKLITKHFPNALFNEEGTMAFASINHNSWDEPKALINFREDWSDASAQAQIAGSSWDNRGEIEISIKTSINK